MLFTALRLVPRSSSSTHPNLLTLILRHASLSITGALRHTNPPPPPPPPPPPAHNAHSCPSDSFRSRPCRLLPAEVFNDKDCPHDDLWPCQEAAVLGSLALFSAPTGAPAGSAARLQWSAPDWSSVSLTPTPLATSPILPDRDLSDEQLQPVQGQGEAAGVGAGGGAEAGYSSAGGSAAASGITGGGHGGGGGGDVDVGGGGSRVLMGERAESCADACARVGLRCSLSTLRELNSCDALRRHYACPSGCEDSIGGEGPAQRTRAAWGACEVVNVRDRGCARLLPHP